LALPTDMKRLMERLRMLPRCAPSRHEGGQ
jgi:hypothetical protein